MVFSDSYNVIAKANKIPHLSCCIIKDYDRRPAVMLYR